MPPPPPLTSHIIMILALKKQIAFFEVHSKKPDLHQNVRNVYRLNDVHMAFAEDVWYVFPQGNCVHVFSSTALDMPLIASRIQKATGPCSTGQTKVMVFESSISSLKNFETLGSGEDSSLLDFVHYEISKAPPPNTKLNIFEPELHADAIVKITPFGDGFTVTLHIKSSNRCILMCDARSCVVPIHADTFTSRVQQVMDSFSHIINWS